MKNNVFDEYNGYKNEVIAILEEAQGFYESQGEVKAVSSIRDNIEVINSGEFEVVVVGEFSAGKSTFLNALMREKYLPSFTKVTTATINYLRNAAESEYPGIAYFVDGHTEILESLDGEIIEKYVSTRNKEMKVEENIKHLDLYLDSPFLEHKVTLIDSPGLNAMEQKHGEITDAQIKRAHAIIFMFSAEQPGKRSDFEYLKKIKDEVNTVFLVLNKIDCIKESEGQTVEDTVKGLVASYKKVFPEDTTLPEIMPVAAYPALVARSKLNLDYPANRFDISDDEKKSLEEKSRMAAFESKLLHFLSNSEKTIMQIREPMQRLQGILGISLKKYENEINIVENERDGAELQERINTLQSALMAMEGNLNEKRGEIRKSVKIIERNILEYLDAELDDVRRQARLKLDDLDSLEILEDYFELLNKLLGRKLNHVVSSLDNKFREEFFDQVQEQYINVISALEDKMDDVTLATVAFDAKINVNANAISVGIENFNSMKEELKNQMRELEEKKKNLSLKEYELIEMSSKNEALQRKLERLERNAAELERTFCPPETVTTIKQGTREVSRSGLARILDLFGKKTETYSYEDRDDSERREYIRNFRENQKRLADRQDELERQLDVVTGADKQLNKVAADRESIQEELKELRRQEIENTKKFNEDLNQKYEKEIERIKNRAEVQIEDFIDEAGPEISKILKKNRDSYTEILQELVEQSIMAQIAQKREECENLLTLKEEANDNKATILNEKRILQSQAQELKEKADRLLVKIDSIKIDRIEYQSISEVV